MAFSEESGTQTAVISTEHTLNATNPETTDCVMQFFLDPLAMAQDDDLEIRIKEKVISGGTQRLIFFTTLSDSQSEAFVTPTLRLKHGWAVTIKQTAGTGRAFPWSIRKVI
jgi:hypothetical protein